ncbi:MAG: carboxypeptidase-like regulatory domain-containing protein [Ignavibacteria bacterium]|nr:carboxypeptidase-like regulatory domain-containing protein [Ignavibacteria bacterium]
MYKFYHFHINFCGNIFHRKDSTESAKTTLITGKVTGEKEEISGANFVIEGTIDGATTDEKGFYEFETEKTGTRIYLFQYGLHYKKIPLTFSPGLNIGLKTRKSKYR